MAMEVDGRAVLARIAARPSDFAMSEAQVNALAVSTLLSRLKDKTLGLPGTRSIADAVGLHDFGLALDNLNDRDLGAFAKRLDPKNAELKSAHPATIKDIILRLAQGLAQPVPAAAKATKNVAPSAGRSRRAKTGEVMQSKALKPRGPSKGRLREPE